MSIRRPLTVTVLALLMPGLLGASAAFGASGGGAQPGELVLPGTPPVTVQIGTPVATAGGNGITIAARSTALLHGIARVRGIAPPGGVRIERFDATLGWVVVASAPVAANGSFLARWRPNRMGAVQLRAVRGAAPPGGVGTVDGSTTAGAQASPPVSVAVYRGGVASWYGPGSYGVTTACGVVLRHATLGVAHRTLPCGATVSLTYGGRTLVVPVIDRGPFVRGRSWDLTIATFHALGGTRADGLLRIGALQVGPPPPGSPLVPPMALPPVTTTPQPPATTTTPAPTRVS